MDAPFRIDSDLATELAATYGTPLYVLSEARLRSRMREYKAAFADAYDKTELSYASKANGTLAVLRIAYEEGLQVDAASEGELRGALLAGVPASNCEFHGNNKSVHEIEFALDEGVRYLIADNFEELDNLARIWKPGHTTRLLLRLAPGVDPKTHKKIATGREDSKFGFNIADGSAEQALVKALEYKLPLAGVHCHVGSQLLAPQAQIDGGVALATFAVAMLGKYDFVSEILNVGGGLGIRYRSADHPVDVRDYCKQIVRAIQPVLEGSGLNPTLAQEPGRSVVGESGVTLYSVGAVKTVPTDAGPKTYVLVDGGLADNPRPVMYDARFDVFALRNSGAGPRTCTISGRHCETDELFPNVELPGDIARGDLVQVLSTGAYNSSMASNYNRYPRPATVLLDPNGKPRLVQKRETWDEMFSREQLPEES